MKTKQPLPEALTAVHQMGVVGTAPAPCRLAVVADDVHVHALAAVTTELEGRALAVICRRKWE